MCCPHPSDPNDNHLPPAARRAPSRPPPHPYTTLSRSSRALRWIAGELPRRDHVDVAIEERCDLENAPWKQREALELDLGDRKSTRLNLSHPSISFAVFCLKKKKKVLSVLGSPR